MPRMLNLVKPRQNKLSPIPYSERCLDLIIMWKYNYTHLSQVGVGNARMDDLVKAQQYKLGLIP